MTGGRGQCYGDGKQADGGRGPVGQTTILLGTTPEDERLLMTDISAPNAESVHIQTTEHQLTQDEVVPVVYRQFSSRWQNWILPAVGVCLVAAGAALLGLDSTNTVAWAVMLALGLAIVRDLLHTGPNNPQPNLEASRQGV